MTPAIGRRWRTLAQLKATTDEAKRAEVLANSGQWGAAAGAFAKAVDKEPDKLPATLPAH